MALVKVDDRAAPVVCFAYFSFLFPRACTLFRALCALLKIKVSGVNV